MGFEPKSVWSQVGGLSAQPAMLCPRTKGRGTSGQLPLGTEALAPPHSHLPPTPPLHQEPRDPGSPHFPQALPVSHLHMPQNSPVFLADRNLEARAPPSLRGAPARPPRGCPHPDARSGLCMAHKAPPAEQGHGVGGLQPRLGIWGWECGRA